MGFKLGFYLFFLFGLVFSIKHEYFLFFFFFLPSEVLKQLGKIKYNKFVKALGYLIFISLCASSTGKRSSVRDKCESQKPNRQESLIIEYGSMQMNKKITYSQKQALGNGSRRK